jgi:NAD(P)-dependent dehydrogenase (short-subunit alcohol dehydrogenase family)
LLTLGYNAPMPQAQTAVVTGGNRGIGAATARALTERGVRVTVFARTAKDLEEVVRRGWAARAVVGDVSSEADVERLFAQHTSELGPCDVLVNNAGVLEIAAVEDLTLAQWKHVLDVNLTGAFLCARAALRTMKPRQQGCIVNVASISGTIGTPKLSAYNASKWGLIGLTHCLAEENRDSKVRCLAVSPGSTDTEMLRKTPFKPNLTPEEVAQVICWSALDAPAAVKGTNLEVFG